MANPKKDGEIKALQDPAKYKPKPILKLLPWIVLIGVFTAGFALYQAGYLDPENLFPIEIKGAACIGVPYKVDFAPYMIPFLNPNWNGIRSGYTFYLGSGTGFPPMGFILRPDGLMTGTPTGTISGNFEVCVKDVGGNFVCRTFHLKVNSECITTTTTNIGNCPATSVQTSTPCHSVQNGVGVTGVIVYDYCPCPSDTYWSGTTDVVTPGGPYKICICS